MQLNQKKETNACFARVLEMKKHTIVQNAVNLFVKIFEAILLKIAATYKNSSKLHSYLKGYMYNIE